MSPSESEDDTKKTGLQPEPLCLFCFPSKDDTPPEEFQQDHQKTYVEAAPKEEAKKEFLNAAMRRKMQHSTPRKQEAPQKIQQPERKSKKRSPSRKRLAEMANSTDTSNESQERKPQSYAEFKKNFHRQKTGRDSFRKKKDQADARRRDEMWLRRRKDGGMKGRRQAQEPSRHLKNYLLNTVKDEKVSQKAALPLIEVLETIKDAWSPSKTLTLDRAQDQSKKSTETAQTMKTESESPFLQFPQPLLNRRYSMPEEVMRKYSVTKERTSEESETNKTMPEITSPSSKEPDETLETEREVKPPEEKPRPRWKIVSKSEVFSKMIDEEDLKPLTDGYDASVSGKDTTGSVYSKETVREKYERTFYKKDGKSERSFVVLNEFVKKTDKEEEVLNGVKSSDEEEKTVKEKSKRGRRVSVVDTTTTKRVTQNEYYNQGKGIIKVKAMEKGSQTGQCTCRTERFASSTTASAKEESDESHSSKSLSSPEQLPKGDNESSDNLSSESDYIQCTCEELESKETSSDMFASGKSTLSQTVSEKSTSTQDSTISINSVPTEGSSVSAESNSTSPELDPKTSAKETTTSPDHTPRTPRSRGRPFNRMNRPDQNYGRRENQEKSRGKPSGRGGGGGGAGGYTRKCPIHTTEEFESNGKDEESYPPETNGEYTRHRSDFPEDLYNIPDRNLDPNPSSYRDSDELNLSGYKPGNPKHQEAKKQKAKLDPSPSRHKKSKNDRNLDSSPSSRSTKPDKKSKNLKPPEDLYNIPDRNVDHSPSSRDRKHKNPKPKPPEDLYKIPDHSPSREKKHKNPKPKPPEDHNIIPHHTDHSPSSKKSKTKTKQPEDLYNIPDRNLDPTPLSARELKRSNTYPDDLYNLPLKNSETHLSSCKDTEHSDGKPKPKKRSPHRESKKPERSQTFTDDLYNLPLQNSETHLSSCKDTEHSDSKVKPKAKKQSPHRESKKPERSHTYPDDLYNLPLQNSETHLSSCKDTEHSDGKSKPKKQSPHREPEKPAKTKKTKPANPPIHYAEDMYNIPDRNSDPNPSPHSQNPCPVHRPKDESPIRSVRFECHDNINCSTPITNDPPVPKIDLSGEDLSSTPKQSEATTERFEETTEKSEEPQPDYKWAKLSQEEVYMMQQQRHRKFVENQRRFSNPLPPTPDKDSLSNCSTNGSPYKEPEDDSLFMIPRYSALPRTLSMVVNTSSGDSVHDDSDNQSLADSLEEHPTTHVHKLYFDTKQETKPVRGDATVLPELPKLKHKEPRGRAFFVSINEPYGEGELLPNIDKIPEPPEKIKDRIFERHLKICKKHSKNLEIEKAEEERIRTQMEESLNKRNLKKLKKVEKKAEEAQKTTRVKKTTNRSLQTEFEKPKESDNHRKLPKIKGRFGSKIPVAVSYQSTSTSPERETPEKKRISKKGPRPRPKKERFRIPNEPLKPEQPIQHQKPQAVIHPSQMPIIDNSELNKRRLSLISSLESTATILQLQPVQFPPRTFNQTKRSPVMKFHQRFEVIPEERSSSMTSSAEERWSNEKNRRASLPVKLTETSTSPIHPELDQTDIKANRPHFRRYSLGSISNLIIAKLMGKPLQAISCIQRGPNNENQQIIVLSPKDALGPNGSSSEGRDALLAMNREDFDRLSKGWMNFYLLKENNGDASDNSQDECRNCNCEKGKTYTLTDFKTIEQEVADAIQERSQQILRDDKFLKEKSDSTEDVKTSEFVLIEKDENHELECLNNEEDKSEQQVNGEEPKEKETTNKTKKKPVKLNDSIKPVKVDENVKPVKSDENVKSIKLDENVRLHCSNTILQTTTKPIDVSPRNLSARTRRQSSLPELRVTTPKNPAIQKVKSSVDILPKVSGKRSDQEGQDSDSTVYFQPPNPKVPLLPLEGSGDFPSDGTISSTSSDEENETKTANIQLPAKYLPLRKRGVSSRTRMKREFYYDSPLNTKPDNGWTVTVAGTVELSRSAPDVEMRLSFPVNSRPPVASQSDSGFAEDANSSQNLDNPKLIRRQSSTVLPPANVKQKWTVTVKKPSQGSLQEGNKLKTKKNYRLLPDLGQPQNRNSKKVLKNTTPRSEKDRETVERKLCSIWPKVQKIIKNELGSHNARLVSELSQVYEDDLRLSVQGSAVPFEKKPRVPTMTERDLTRGLTARSNRSKT